MATRHPEWFRAFVIGNTWAWPLRGDRATEMFSKILGSSVLGGLLVRRADLFVNVFMRGGIRRKKLTPAERRMYKMPHPTPDSRLPVHVMPREILAAHDLLAEVENRLARVADKPALIVWGEKDPGLAAPPAALGTHLPQPPHPHPPRSIALHPRRRPRRDRHRDQGLVARPARRRMTPRLRRRDPPPSLVTHMPGA